jgi:hypothetical protein
MACHRSALHKSAVDTTRQHCHNMADMREMESDASLMPSQNDEASIAGSADNQCPMGCCAVTGSANHAAPTSPLMLTAPVVMEHQVSFAEVLFSRNGFSSHTDRGPPLV